jgi:hypothetical protein
MSAKKSAKGKGKHGYRNTAVGKMPTGKTLEERIAKLVMDANRNDVITNRVDLLHYDSRRMSFRAKATRLG